MAKFNINFLKSKRMIIFGFTIFLFVFFNLNYYLQKQLIDIYKSRESIILKDRYGQEIFIKPNEKGNFARYLDEVPPWFKELLIKKEDKYFYYHFGFNPWSISQAGLGYLGIGNRKGSSTISQQLVKILLAKEFERSLKTKILESFYTLSLEIFQSKEEILKMYVNSVYFGNQAQGLAEASRLYFDTSPDLLTDGQILQLISSIHSPTKTNPAKLKNKEITLSLAKKWNLNISEIEIIEPEKIKESTKKYLHFNDSYFETQSLINDFSENNQLTLDRDLTEKIRKIVQRNIEELKPKNVKHGAVIVIKLPENEILTLIGSPDPKSFEEGYQINMLKEPRPIGSTIKPFIYLKAFEKDLRPYTLIDDREYKYITAIGFPLYPKNFDYQYRGQVNLHYALSNSLNVPTVKVLEYVGLENFYQFLGKDLEFKPVQPLDNYQLGIALGVLEMSLWDLAKYFTIFPNEGILREHKIYLNDNEKVVKVIAKPEYIQLVNKILNDRKTGIDQFGLLSELNLFQENYALKTGTSRDFHDSWIIGFTPDFLVGVWVGNTDNTPTEAVSGQIGAGRIWSEVMELLFHSQYNKKTPFNFDLIEEFYQTENIEYGLADDDYEKILNALKERDLTLILNPHPGDVFLLEQNTKIILEAKESVKWFIHPVKSSKAGAEQFNGVNEEFLGEGKSKIFIPQRLGQYQIKAVDFDGIGETITIYIQGSD